MKTRSDFFDYYLQRGNAIDFYYMPWNTSLTKLERKKQDIKSDFIKPQKMYRPYGRLRKASFWMKNEEGPSVIWFNDPIHREINSRGSNFPHRKEVNKVTTPGTIWAVSFVAEKPEAHNAYNESSLLRQIQDDKNEVNSAFNRHNQYLYNYIQGVRSEKDMLKKLTFLKNPDFAQFFNIHLDDKGNFSNEEQPVIDSTSTNGASEDIWMLNNRIHRVDGPAVTIYASGGSHDFYWYKGLPSGTKEEHEAMLIKMHQDGQLKGSEIAGTLANNIISGDIFDV